jgi:chromosome segregation ATPase
MKRVVAEKDATIKEHTDQVARLTRQASDADQARTTAEAQAAKDRAQNELLSTAHKEATANLASATRSLAAAQVTIQSNQQLISTLQEARQKLTEQVLAANDAKDAAIRQTNQTQVAVENLQREKEAQAQQIEDIQKQLQSSRFENEARQRRGGDASDIPTDQPPSLSGRVLAADNAANVVVISLGDEDKVKIGHRYIVARGDQYIATIVVTKTEAKKSAARSLKDLQKSPPQVGDTVLPR